MCVTLNMSARQRRKTKPATAVQHDEDEEMPQGIKWKYVFFFVLLFGTGMAPFLFMLVDAVKPVVGNSLSRVSAQIGLAPTPKMRLVKFYEKHNPDKVKEVDALIGKYTTDYPKMVKILEAKYQDYGFFLGWEKDNEASKIFQRYAAKYSRLARYYYRKHVPIDIRMAFFRMYNIIYNALRPLIDQLHALLKFIRSLYT